MPEDNLSILKVSDNTFRVDGIYDNDSMADLFHSGGMCFIETSIFNFITGSDIKIYYPNNDYVFNRMSKCSSDSITARFIATMLEHFGINPPYSQFDSLITYSWGKDNRGIPNMDIVNMDIKDNRFSVRLYEYHPGSSIGINMNFQTLVKYNLQHIYLKPYSKSVKHLDKIFAACKNDCEKVDRLLNFNDWRHETKDAFRVANYGKYM